MKSLILSFLLLISMLNGKPKYSFDISKDLVFVAGGNVFFAEPKVDQNGIPIPSDSLASFFIGATEVTNRQYKDFVDALKAKGANWEEMLPDTTAWRLPGSYNEPLVKHYYQHQKYDNYPVVGVTLVQANAYAKWLSSIFPKYMFSIPTKSQWVYAGRRETLADYTHDWFQDANGKYNYNFKQLDQESVAYNAQTDKYELKGRVWFNYFADGYLYPANTKAFSPSAYGIYELCGNVAELVSDDSVAMGGSWNDAGYDIRILSEKPAAASDCTIGFRIAAALK
jgi:formylglycine-generating enzyme required for sulfatase activity